MATTTLSPSADLSQQDDDTPSSQSSLDSFPVLSKREDNSLLSFRTNNTSSGLVFDVLCRELQTDSSTSSKGSPHSSGQSPPDTREEDEPLKPEDLGVVATSERPQPPLEQLSPARKAIAAKFDTLSMGPPQHASSRLNASNRPPSPFKRALMNSHRSNVQQSGQGSPSSPSSGAEVLKASNYTDRPGTAHPHPDESSGPDTSLSLNHQAANASLDFDLIGAPDDSFLVEAKRLGDESFDRRILDRSPRKADRSPRKQSTSPRKQQPPAPVTAAPAMTPLKALLASRQDRSSTTALSSPRAARPEPGNALGLGMGESNAAGDKGVQVRHDSSPINLDLAGQRSFFGDTSDLFEEQGEQSLLYPSTRLRVKPGAAGGARQKLLAALAEVGEDEHTSRPTDSPTRAQVPEAPTSLFSSGSRMHGAAQPSASTPPAEEEPTSKALKRRSVPVVMPSRTRTAEAETPSKPTSAGPRNGSPTVKSRTTAGLSRSTSLRSRPSLAPKAPTSATPRLRTAETPKAAAAAAAPEEATPRSRPPLNASAARMRRLSALPQLVDDDGNMKRAPPSSYKAGAASGNAPARPEKKERPRSMIGRPSLAPAAPTDASQSSPRAKRNSAVPSSIQSSRPRPHSFIGVGSTTSARDRDDPEQFSGQLPRKSPTVTPPTLPTNLPGSGTSSGKKAPRPFLLGSGTNHAASPTEPPRLGSSPRKSAMPAPALPPKSRARPSSLIQPRDATRGTTSACTASPSRPRASVATSAGISKSSSAGSIASSSASRLPRQSMAAPTAGTSGGALARRSSVRSRTNAPTSYRGPIGLGAGTSASGTSASGTSDSARQSHTTAAGSSRVAGMTSSGSASRLARPRPSTVAGAGAAGRSEGDVAAGASTPRAKSTGATAAACLGLSRASSLKSSLGRAGREESGASTAALSRSSSSSNSISGARRTHRRTESQQSGMSTASSSSSVSTIRG